MIGPNGEQVGIVPVRFLLVVVGMQHLAAAVHHAHTGVELGVFQAGVEDDAADGNLVLLRGGDSGGPAGASGEQVVHDDGFAFDEQLLELLGWNAHQLAFTKQSLHSVGNRVLPWVMLHGIELL